MPTRFNLEVLTHAPFFCKEYNVVAYTDEYLCFVSRNGYAYNIVSLYKTSAHCYRVMAYKSCCGVPIGSVYKSFRTCLEMCLYLERFSQ